MNSETLLTYLANAAGGQPVEDETRLFSSGLLDSFDLAALLAFVETTAGKRIRASDVSLENFDSAARILQFAAR